MTKLTPVLAKAISFGIVAALSLAPQPPIRVPKTPGSFDYMLVDAPAHRLLVAHTGSRAFAIFNSGTGALESQLSLSGAPHGIAIDRARDVYLVSTSLTHEIAVISRSTLRAVGTIQTPGPVDAIALDTRRDRLFADEDNGESIWVIDSRERIIHTLHTPQDSDKSEYDPQTDRLYQNFTTINATYVIDAASWRVLARWSTLPATKPHGIALDSARKRAYVAGTNGKLVALDLANGSVVSSVEIKRNVDQIAFDATRSRIYCASGDGFVSVAGVGAAGLKHLADVPIPIGAHTLALDPGSGALWVSYGTDRDDYIMELVPSR